MLASLSNETVPCIPMEEAGKLNCSGIIYEISETLSPDNKMFWVYLGIYCALVLLAGLMSGLTMGLLSLDVMSLHVLTMGGKPHEKKYAKRILPLVKRHHLLLVTLLLANAAAVESMPLFLDKISNPITAIVVSVTAVLIFGEVVPQALCTRYGLAIGAFMSPFVMFLIAITFPISWPLSKLLDLVLGEEHGTFFRRAELKALVDLHNTETGAENEEPLTQDEALIIKGALSMRDKTVAEICTPVKDVYSLNHDSCMNREQMDEIIRKGHSRVPVYEEQTDRFIGVMLVKNLIKLDPDDNLLVSDIFSNYKRPLLAVTEDTKLYECLNLFQMGKSHMFMVIKSGFGQSKNTSFPLTLPNDTIIGLLTLEDVIEELIQEEIIDETDVYIDIEKKIKVSKSRVARRSANQIRSAASSVQSPSQSIMRPNVDDDTKPLLGDDP